MEQVIHLVLPVPPTLMGAVSKFKPTQPTPAPHSTTTQTTTISTLRTDQAFTGIQIPILTGQIPCHHYPASLERQDHPRQAREMVKVVSSQQKGE